MDAHRSPQGKFDIAELPDYIPRRAKPWLFILIVIIVQFSGGVYLAAVSDMTGSTALMQEDILMAGYAQLVGMAVNFAVMFRLKFRFPARSSLLVCLGVLAAANIICTRTDNMAVLIPVCFLAGWFRMWATFVCNSTIQLWLTPVRDMSVFFCYVYLLVDSSIQLSGIATVYTAFLSQWQYMHTLMTGLLIFAMLVVLALVRHRRAMPYIPLLGIDWTGAALWSIFMLSFTFICVYGEFYDWWDSGKIIGATVLGSLCAVLNLWRATFLRHPYISLPALTNRNVVTASAVYFVFFTLLSAEHVCEHAYAGHILEFDATNTIDLNLYVLAGILAGIGFTYLTFARRRWSYTSMTAIAFGLAAIYLAHFYFTIDYDVEKHALFVPLFCRGAASVIISTVFLTSVVQSGLSFQVFPQALTVNGFTGAVMSATLGPAILGELLRQTSAKHYALLSANLTGTDLAASHIPTGTLYGMVQRHALLISMKEIFGWLLLAAIVSLILILANGAVRRCTRLQSDSPAR